MPSPLAETSTVTKAQLYFSSVDEFGQAVYSMVSEGATLFAVDRLGTNGIRKLYQHAAFLRNPEFLGWVVEADLLNRCNSGRLSLKGKGEIEDMVIITHRESPVDCVFDYGYLFLFVPRKRPRNRARNEEACSRYRRDSNLLGIRADTYRG